MSVLKAGTSFTLLFLIIILSNCSNTDLSQKLNKPPYPNGRRLSSEERKEITNKFLRSIDVPTLNNLPLVEDYSNAHFRSDIEVARRCIILYNLIYVSHHERSADKAVNYLKKYKLWSDVAPSEIKYLTDKNRFEQADIDMTWQIERLNVLLWSLSIIKELPLPVKQCDFTSYKNLPDIDNNPLNWIENAKLRNKEDILNETDLIYRIDWATTDARINNKPIPYHFNNDVVHERHFVFNWLVMYGDDWDDITTDT